MTTWRRFGGPPRPAVLALAEIAALRGVRFNQARTGPIGPLLAPPYDVARAPENGAELSISRIENVDLGVAGNQHSHAARQYRDWLSAGVLRVDAEPGIYVHRHEFAANGLPVERTGIIARVRLHDWADRIVLPHEKTNAGPRAERRERLRSVGANLSPLYFLYRDPAGELRNLLSGQAGDEGVVELDRMGGRHRLTQIVDPALLDEVADFFRMRSLFVADGHHRYEAALENRDEMRRKRPGQDGPWEYVLALLAAVEDPGVQIWPTHRVLRPEPSLTPEKIREIASRWFEVRPAGENGGGSGQALFRLILPGEREPLTVVARPGAPHLALVAQEPGEAWKSLGVVAVEGLLNIALGGSGADNGRQVVPLADETLAVQMVKRSQASAAFLLEAPDLDRVLTVAEEGDLMPPKSTWFEPKAPAGLVINDLTLSAP